MNIVFKKYVEAAEAMFMPKAIDVANSIFKKEFEDFMKGTLLTFPTLHQAFLLQ